MISEHCFATAATPAVIGSTTSETVIPPSTAPAAEAIAPAAAPVERLILPLLPAFNSVAAVCVIEPPVAFPPVLVATVIFPPFPVVILRSAAVPVPPPEVFTLMATALALVSVVVIDPAVILKVLAPAPSLFAFKVTVPEEEIVCAIVKLFEACSKRLPLVKLAAVNRLPPLLCKFKAPVPVLIAVPGKVKTPEEITVSGTFATLKVGAAKVRLPVLDTKAPSAFAVIVKVPVVTVAIGVPLEPMAPGVKGAEVELPIESVIPPVPELSDFPTAMIIFPLTVSLSPTGLLPLVVALFAEVALESLAVTVMSAFVVPTLSLINTLRPAFRVSVLPLREFVQPLVMTISEFACKVRLAFTFVMLLGSMVVVPAALFA